MQITFNCFSLLYEKVAHTLVGIVNTSYLIQTIDFFLISTCIHCPPPVYLIFIQKVLV